MMLSVNEDLLNMIKDCYPSFEADHANCVQMITKVNRHGAHDERILALTDYNAYLFTPSLLKRSARISRYFRWDTLLAIRTESILSFQLVFKDGTMTLIDQNSVQLVVSVATHISNILLKHEWPKFEFDPEYLDGYKQSSDAMIKRMMFKSYVAGTELPEGLIKEMKILNSKIIKMNENIPIPFYLKRFIEFYPYTEFILAAIEVCPQIKRLIVPYKPKQPYWEFLANFLRTNRTITSLEIYDDPNHPKFKDFYESFAINPNNQIDDISFNNGKFNQMFVVNLAIILESKCFHRLILNNGVTADGFQIMASMMPNVKGFKSLVAFQLSQCRSIQPNTIISNLPQLTVLRLEDCNIEVADVFIALNDLPESHIRELNLGKNRLTVSLDSNLKLPKDLKILNLDNLTIENNALLFLIYLLSQEISRENKLILSICRLKMSNEQWDELNTYLYSIYILMNTLLFDQNRIGNGFITFFEKCNLQKLSVKGCLATGDPILTSFTTSIQKNTTIKELNIGGAEGCFLGDSLPNLLNVIIENQSITSLDISGNMTGITIYDSVLNLLEKNPRIKEISLDGNNHTNGDAIKQFYSNVRQFKRRVFVQTPINDITAMKNAKLLNERDINELWVIIKQFQNNRDCKAINNSQGRPFSFNSSVIPNPLTAPSSTNIKLNKKVRFNPNSNQNQPSNNHHNMAANERRALPVFDEREKQLDPEIPPEVHALNDRVNEEYVNDQQWISIIDDVPEHDLETVYLDFYNQYLFENLLNEIRMTQ
ncbi:hypothetical protein TRFO_06874 [Tritrichomonas foetus]|uniref:Leucine Rich Repeat family protein n=1 Tax=Tritrichomonas foetus TaxID=1144522 RepID=A0A1J4JVL9_9EUKA|nr:hypothetical protein TRFO_06874 [Tritrichomonas foetus]|eukprot:OHT03185.1 hypothetical protein TRFO_06874 [Tritrichomonas foetus]